MIIIIIIMIYNICNKICTNIEYNNICTDYYSSFNNYK